MTMHYAKVDFALLSEIAQPWAGRPAVLRAARFLRLEDRAHEIPPTGIFARSKNKLIPYIFTPDDLRRLLEAATELHRHQYYPVQRQRYGMLFGLIAATGLRVTEALDLRLGDILPGGVLHIRETKFHKSRLVPLHPTVEEALDRYLDLRRRFAGLMDHLFLSTQGDALSLSPWSTRRSARSSGTPTSHRAGYGDPASTICATALRRGFWSNAATEREAIARHFVALMTYMGHADISIHILVSAGDAGADDRHRHSGRSTGYGGGPMTRLAPLITGFLRDHMPAPTRLQPA